MQGRGPSFFGSVDLLLQRQQAELEAAADQLRGMGWTMREHRHGWLVARRGRREVTAITGPGLVRAAERSAKRALPTQLNLTESVKFL